MPGRMLRLSPPTRIPMPRWGLHVDDPNLAMGNLVKIVRSEAMSYVEASAPAPPN